MKEFNLKDFLPKKLFLFMVPILFMINYGISYFAKYLEIPGVKNTLPFSLNIDSQILYMVFGFTILFLLLTKMLNNHPLSSSFIIAGALYNLFEKTYYGHVFDFIKITWGFINLADLMLWFGLILLNYEVWFNKDDEFEQVYYVNAVNNTPLDENQNSLAIIDFNIQPVKQIEIQEPIREVIKEVINEVVKETVVENNFKPIIEEPIKEQVIEEDKKSDILKSLQTSKIKTVTDQLNKIKSADSQEIFIPKMDIKPKKQTQPRIIVNQ